MKRSVAIFMFAILTTLLGCRQRVKSTSDETNPSVASAHRVERDPQRARDYRVLEAVILDLLEFNEFHGTCEGKTPCSIVCDVELPDNPMSPERLQSMVEDLAERRLNYAWDAGQDLFRRSMHKPPALRASTERLGPSGYWQDLDPAEGRIVLANLVEFDDFYRSFPDAKGWISTGLPGFSDDGSAALVRFACGPSGHGAAGTYYLRRLGNRWAVEWRDIVWYF